jgi:DNA-binding CsgD family transcriptional regulator
LGITNDLERAREAVDRRDWPLAYELLRQADELSPEDTMALATAAYLTGNLDAAVRALQRGYQARIRDHDPLGAVRFASWLGLVLNVQGEFAVGAGWVSRAQSLLEGQPEEVMERGHLLLHEFYRRLGSGNLAGAGDVAARVVETGRRFSNHDLIAQGLMCRGRWLIYAGRVPEGLALLDEAMIGLTAGEVSPIVAGLVYCSLIEACQELSDFGRASSWTRALAHWCDDQPGMLPFTGQCALHKGQILRLTGAYDDALSEFAAALRRYELWGTPAPAGLALNEKADVLRIKGELEAAEATHRQASDLGHDPQPGLALCWLARGRTAAAVSAIRRVLAEVPDPVHRCKLLPAAVEVLLAAGHLDESKPIADELAGIAAAFGGAALAAMAAYAAATVHLAAGEAADALRVARESLRLWSEMDSPYEVARSRVVVAQALRNLGDEDSAVAELNAARHTFAELGAVPALQGVDRLQRRTTPGGLTERELEVLRLVAEGRGNPEIARVLFLSQKTVARHLSNIFVKLNVSSRTAAAAYAHEHRLLS